MPTVKKTAHQRTLIAKKGVQSRRKKHPGGDTERLSVDTVEKTFNRRKSFSTLDIMTELGAAKDNATAVCAVLRARNLIKRVGETSNGASIWNWTQ